MHGPVSKTFQYLYFIRFSLLLWLFPVVFFALDSGVLSISTTTLTRAIFVPEYLSGYVCVGFFVTATACVALITARTVVLNGVERFPPRPPDCVERLITANHACEEENNRLNKPPAWLENLLASKEARGERRAVLIALIPAALTFLYLIGCGQFEEVSVFRIVPGLIIGFLMSAAFWYLVNALYYFAYERPDNLPPNTPLELGKNAARTILLPRRAFWLRMPGQGVLADGPPHTLEDIRTNLRNRWFATFGGRITDRLRRKFGLTGYCYKNGRIYEAQLFSFIAAVGFLGLFLVLYPLTAPRPNNASFVAVAVVVAIFIWLVGVIRSGHFREPMDKSQKRLLRRWQIGLTGCALFFCFTIVYLWLVSDSERFPTMAAVQLLMILLTWAFSALAFWLDRHRVPVLTFAILLAVAPRLLHVYDLWGAEEHFVSTVPRNGAATLPTPAQILDAHLSDPSAALERHPLIIVTATGGGLHASAWTTQVLRQLYLRLPAEQLTNHILVMSTVSGGSVGLEYYLEAINANPAAPNLDRMVVGAQCSSLEAVGWGLVYYDATRAAIPIFPYLLWRSAGDEDLDTTPLLKDRTWALRKSFERNSGDAYCWESARTSAPADQSTRLNLDDAPPKIPWYKRLFPTSNSSGTRLTIGGLTPGAAFPAFTMNTTTVEGGNRFLLANYRLPDYEVGPIEGPAAESFLAEFPSGNQPDLPLAAAAQMSATFPYVSSAVRIPTKYTAYSEHFVDGGYYDNDGTSSAIEFLRYALDPPVSGRVNPDPQDAKAKQDIAGQGAVDILLIEIRNSADTDVPVSQTTQMVLHDGEPNPPRPWSHAGLLQQSGFPLEGFWNAGHGSVTARDRNGLDLLIQSHVGKLHIHQIIFDDQTQPDDRWYIHSAQDPLSWSLTPKERREVTTSSDPGKSKAEWLNPCYENAVTWFNNFRDLFDSQEQDPKRCKKSGS